MTKFTGIGESGKVEWLLKRNCALTPRQLLLFYLSLIGVSSLIATGFALIGAWMIMPFAGLEMAVLGIALAAYARHALDHERVTLGSGELVVETVVAGKSVITRMNAGLARVDIGAHFRSPIMLVERRCAVQVGRYVSDTERRAFAQELKRALANHQWA